MRRPLKSIIINTHQCVGVRSCGMLMGCSHSSWRGRLQITIAKLQICTFQCVQEVWYTLMGPSRFIFFFLVGHAPVYIWSSFMSPGFLCSSKRWRLIGTIAAPHGRSPRPLYTCFQDFNFCCILAVCLHANGLEKVPECTVKALFYEVAVSSHKPTNWRCDVMETQQDQKVFFAFLVHRFK